MCRPKAAEYSAAASGFGGVVIYSPRRFNFRRRFVPTLQELLAQRAALEKQIAETQRQERADAIAKVKALMAEYGLSAADIVGKASPPARNPAAGGGRKVAPKYRNPATGETWTGRGLQPNWLKSALASGKQLSDFSI
jgi:DNA-binding protein H-NS